MTAPRVVTLTYAQRRVLGELTRDGADNTTIARRLQLSPDTVRTHMKGIFFSFGVSTRAAVVAMCLHREVVVRIATRSTVTRTPGPRRPINHGTWGGYAAHRQRASDPCDDCTHAWAGRVVDLRVQLDEARRKRWAS